VVAVVTERGKPVYHEGKVHVMAEMCSTCVFRPGNLMRLAPGRLKDMVDTSVADGAGITCHKTIHGRAEQEATCRGFFDASASRHTDWPRPCRSSRK
jgi:hypothetical protein